MKFPRFLRVEKLDLDFLRLDIKFPRFLRVEKFDLDFLKSTSDGLLV